MTLLGIDLKMFLAGVAVTLAVLAFVAAYWTEKHEKRSGEDSGGLGDRDCRNRDSSERD